MFGEILPREITRTNSIVYVREAASIARNSRIPPNFPHRVAREVAGSIIQPKIEALYAQLYIELIARFHRHNELIDELTQLQRNPKQNPTIHIQLQEKRSHNKRIEPGEIEKMVSDIESQMISKAKRTTMWAQLSLFTLFERERALAGDEPLFKFIRKLTGTRQFAVEDLQNIIHKVEHSFPAQKK